MEKTLKQQQSNCIKIVLFGPESTGKTTLANQLARYYNSIWVPEYAREYLQKKWNNERKTCEPSDILPIAKGQMKLENELAQKTDSVLICDTDLLETKVYSEEYYSGTCNPLLEKYAIKNSYDLYFLTNIDIPWEKDDLRDKPNDREHMFNAFKTALIKYKKSFVLLEGNKEKRLKKAIKYIDILIQNKIEFYQTRHSTNRKTRIDHK
ncbi:MAG: AAA family ATPase [Flavobacteriales bacterium]